MVACTSDGILTTPNITTLPSGAFIVNTYGLKPSHGVLPKYLTYAAAKHAKSKGCTHIVPVDLPMSNQFSKAYRCSKSGLFINDLLAAGSE